METLHDIGEFGFIECFAKKIHTDKDVVKGIGDDAAVINTGDKDYLLITADMLVEGVHFLRTMMTPQEIGRKALACSISDIAAMGGLPTYAVISLGAPSNISAQLINEIGQGINALAREFGVSLVGGDTIKNEQLIINVTLLGKVKKSEAIYRQGAQKGDVIFVTGALGNSFKSRKHLRFKPCIEQAQFLVKNVKPAAMTDVSDGLAGDLGHILKQSKTGALLYEKKIPLAKGATLHQALHDGEDFELLFTVRPKDAEKVRKTRKFKFCEIGTVTSGKVLMMVDRLGRKRAVEMTGFEHF